jgi:6-phosphogluconolactonase
MHRISNFPPATISRPFIEYTGVDFMSIRWHKYSDPRAAAEACARHTLGLLTEMLSGQECATMAVSGGVTPGLYFDALTAARFKWDRVHLFFVDERAVPPDHPDSNFRLAEEHLIKKTRMVARQVHRIHGEMEPHEAAQAYIEDIRGFFDLKPGETPHFDIIHRGMGPDAHTASLFPGDPHIEDREGIAAAVYVEKKQMWRVTLLPAVLMAAKHTIFLVTGEDKAEAVRSVLEEPYDPMKYPAQMSTHHGRGVAMFFDTAAAGSLIE